MCATEVRSRLKADHIEEYYYVTVKTRIILMHDCNFDRITAGRRELLDLL
jgi:hypothetical protein